MILIQNVGVFLTTMGDISICFWWFYSFCFGIPSKDDSPYDGSSLFEWMHSFGATVILIL